MSRHGALILLSLLAPGCTDPSAVRSFADQTPPNGSFQGMLQYYASIGPALTQVTEVGARRCPDPMGPDKAILLLEPMHNSWVAYMTALGLLADDKPVQRVGADAKQVTDGLAKVQKARPNFGITSGEINVIGDLVKIVEDAVVRKMRQVALNDVISRAQPGFQAAMSLEGRVIQEGYVKDLQNYNSEFQSLGGTLRHSFNAHLSSGTRASVGVLPAGQAILQQSCLSNEIIIGHVLLPTDVSTKQAAAEVYASALVKLAALHTHLLADASRNQLLTQATFDQIKPLVDEARQAWADFQKLN